MWTVEDFGGNVLVHYLRKKDKVVPVIRHKMDGGVDGMYADLFVEKGQRIGVVVAIGPGILGWSLCDSADVFDRDKGLHIALGRAVHAEIIEPITRINFYATVPDSLLDICKAMMIRSLQYFK